MGKRALNGKVVVITGGARGIGAATARALRARGARVVIADLKGEEAKATAAGLGRDAAGHALDVTDHGAVTAFLDEVGRTHGRLDVLINNAGIMPLAPILDESPATTARQLEINLHAVIHGTREAMSRMLPRGEGHIINVASAAGKIGFKDASTYCATKHGVVGFSEAVRSELRGTGVEISCVMPGVVQTELASGISELGILKTVRPEDVALAMVRALERPRFDVFVPRRLNALIRSLRLVPRKTGEWAMRVLGADALLSHGAGSPARSAYESRAAESAPAADAARHES